MKHLLDTNAWVAYLRGKDAGLIRRLNQVNPDSITLCSIVVAELIHGAHKSGPAYYEANLDLIAQLRLKFDCLPFDEPAAAEWGRIRHELEQKGLLIGPHDLLIAAIALASNLILVTHNTREFSRVPGLKIEDWQSP